MGVQISWDFLDRQEKYRFPVYFSNFVPSLEIYGFSVFFANGSPDQLGLFGPSRKIQVSRIFLKFWAFPGNIRLFRIFRKWESTLVGTFWTVKKNTGFPYISQIRVREFLLRRKEKNLFPLYFLIGRCARFALYFAISTSFFGNIRFSCIFRNRESSINGTFLNISSLF